MDTHPFKQLIIYHSGMTPVAGRRSSMFYDYPDTTRTDPMRPGRSWSGFGNCYDDVKLYTLEPVVPGSLVEEYRCYEIIYIQMQYWTGLNPVGISRVIKRPANEMELDQIESGHITTYTVDTVLHEFYEYVNLPLDRRASRRVGADVVAETIMEGPL
jgi:hypothetical protein